MRFVFIAIAIFYFSHQLHAEEKTRGEWPPTDPGQYKTKIKFTETWAKKIQGFHTIADLQRIAGSKGTRVQSDDNLNDDHPNITFEWSDPTSGDLMATIYKDGLIFLRITTDNSIDMTASNTGSFHCEKCCPTIQIQMQEPAWLNGGWGQGDYFKAISVRDFLLDGEILASSNQQVGLCGFYLKYGKISYLFQEKVNPDYPDTSRAIVLLTDIAPREFRNQLLDCTAGCQVMVQGNATRCALTIFGRAEGDIPCIQVDDGARKELSATTASPH